MSASLSDEVAFISNINADGTLALYSYDAWNPGTIPADYSGGYTNAMKWGGITAGTSGGTVYYYFNPASNWTSTEQTFLAAGLALWSDIANISFALTTNSTQAQIKFTRGSNGSAATSPSAMDTSPTRTAGQTGSTYLLHMTSATISIDTHTAGFGPISNFSTYGGYPIDTLVHEEGHAIGLGHAGPYNDTVNAATQQYGPYDTRLWSIMSYIEPGKTTAEYYSQYPVTGTNWNGNDPTTWMPADILAAQALYGLPTSTPLSGGQTFGFNCNVQGPSEMFFDFTKNTNPVITIWDMGTNNTLDLSGFFTASKVNLNAGSFSSCDGMTNNLAIAFNTAIDTVVCGTGNDVIVGNNDGDTLIGGGGNDLITGGSGNDRISASGNSTVDGGGGINTFIVNAVYSAGAISSFGSATHVFGVTLTNVQFVQFQDQTIQISSGTAVSNIVLTTSNITARANSVLALSSLFTVTDSLGNPITAYQLWDSTRDSNAGYFTVNGAIQAAGTVINVSAAQLAQTSFVAGSVATGLQIRAFDGVSWSAADSAAWAPFTVSPPPNHPPVVTTGPVSTSRNQTLAASSLFTVSDADGDTMTRYELWDSTSDPVSGHWVVNGVVQAAGTVIDITAAQLAQTSFVTGKVSDNLQIRAFDGTSWSAADTAPWSPFTISPPPDHPPVVTTTAVNALHGRTLALSSLFSVTDADGDAVTRYQLWDSTRDPTSGYFAVNGVAQPAGTVIDITAAQLSQTSFVTGQVSDNLQIRAFDGINWSAGDNAAWSPFSVSVTPYTAPALTTQDINTTAGQALPLSSLLSVNDPDGDTMTRYELWDSTRDPNSGNWVVNGAIQSAGTVIDITAAQLSQTFFATGTLGDSLQIRAFDGISWTASDTAAWAPFHINVS